MENNDFLDALLTAIKLGAGVGAALGVMLSMWFSGKVFMGKLGQRVPNTGGFDTAINDLREAMSHDLRELLANLKQEITLTEGRLGIRIDRVEMRLDTRMGAVEHRLDAFIQRDTR